METLSFSDRLKNVFRYPQMLKLLKAEFSRARRYDFPLSLVLLEMINLRNLRDVHGYEAGEFIASEVIRLIEEESRISDFVCQYRGDVFAVILTHTDLKGARTFAERILKRMESTGFKIGEITVKIIPALGVAYGGEKNALYMDSLLENAAKALESARQRGGACYEVFPPTTSS
jgi:two-component system cell cycle response regulator